MSLSIRRLNHITINAPSGEEQKVRDFYGKILGLKEVELPRSLTAVYEIVWFELLDYLLHVEFTHHFVKPQTCIENGVLLPGRHFAIEIKGIKGVRRDLESNNIEILEAVEIPDRDRFYCVDPFGNVLELIEFHKDQLP